MLNPFPQRLTPPASGSMWLRTQQYPLQFLTVGVHRDVREHNVTHTVDSAGWVLIGAGKSSSRDTSESVGCPTRVQVARITSVICQRNRHQVSSTWRTWQGTRNVRCGVGLRRCLRSTFTDINGANGVSKFIVC